MHEGSEDFEIRRNLTTDCGVSCPLALDKKLHRRIMEKWGCHFFSAVFEKILFILAGNDDIHKSLEEFRILSDPIPNHRVTCP